MFTKTSINKEVLLKLTKAMADAQHQSVAHVRNKKGHAFMAVRKRVVDGKVLFLVTDRHDNNIKPLVVDQAVSLMHGDVITPATANMFMERLAFQSQLGSKSPENRWA